MDIDLTRRMLNLSEEDCSEEDIREIIDFTESLADIFLDEYRIKKEKKEVKVINKSNKIKLHTRLPEVDKNDELS